MSIFERAWSAGRPVLIDIPGEFGLAWPNEPIRWYRTEARRRAAYLHRMRQ